MSIFLSILFFAIGTILAAIAIASWQKGGYGNYWIAFWWGIAAYALLGVGVFFTYYAYVIKPASKAQNAPSTLDIKPTPEGRAYLGVLGQVLQQPIKAGQPVVEARITIINTGQAHATNVTTRHAMRIGPDEPTEEEILSIPPLPGSTPSKSVVIPGGDVYIDMKAVLDAQRVTSIELETNKLYLMGFLDYDDSSGVHHRTVFCYTYIPGTVHFKSCSVGNSIS